MNSKMRSTAFVFSALLVLGVSAGSSAQQANMSFVVTSAGSGKGADLGGLEGRTGSANSWRRPSGPEAAPGMPTSARKRPTVGSRSARAIASGMVHGRTPRG